MANDPYEVLGVRRDASMDEIKQRYRELARKYHPDKYAGNELIDLAEEKMKMINEAYDAIVKERSGQSGSSQYGPAGQNPNEWNRRPRNPYERQPYGEPGCTPCDCCAGMMCADCLCSSLRCC